VQKRTLGQGLEVSTLLREIAAKAAQIRVQGERYPVELQRRVDR
jgi:hypothetical protein